VQSVKRTKWKRQSDKLTMPWKSSKNAPGEIAPRRFRVR